MNLFFSSFLLHSFFSQRVQNKGNKSYGVGVYTSKHAIYPDVLRPHGTNVRQLILAKVALGACKEYGSDKSPDTKAMAPNGYHSVSGTEGDMAFIKGWINDELAQPPHLQNKKQLAGYRTLVANGAEYGRQYVVHRSNQAYPAYLVTYST